MRSTRRVSPFPLSSKCWTGDNETFTLTGSVTVDGSKINIGLAVRATRFSEGQGPFDTSGLPDALDVDMAEPFQWSRSQQEDRLLQTTVQGTSFNLYVVAPRSGRPASGRAKNRVAERVNAVPRDLGRHRVKFYLSFTDCLLSAAAAVE